MASGRCPAGRAETPPRWAVLAFGQIHQRIARKNDRGLAVCLRAEPRMMRVSPLANWLQIVVLRQFRQSLAPIVPHGQCVMAHIGHQRRKIGSQNVPAPLLELFQKVGSPVGTENFQAVAEYSVWRRIAEG